MKVEQPDLRRVKFDCPWTGHAYGEGGIEVRNSKRSDIVGMQCVKCGALVYERVKPPTPTPAPSPSGLVGPGGAPARGHILADCGDDCGAPVLVTAARDGGD